MNTRTRHVSPDELHTKGSYVDPSLLKSVMHHGVLLSVLVKKRKGGGYDVIDGHKRVSCVRYANRNIDLGLKVPIRVVSGDAESIRKDVNRPVDPVVQLPDWLLEAWTRLRPSIQVEDLLTVQFEMEEEITTIYVCGNNPCVSLERIYEVMTLRGGSSITPGHTTFRGELDGHTIVLTIEH